MTGPVHRFGIGRIHPAFIWLYLLLGTANLPSGVLGRRRQQRSLRELSNDVHRELRFVAHGASGFDAAALVPRATKRIHSLLVEGAINEDVDELDADARALAMEALHAGARSSFQEARMRSSDFHSRALRGGQTIIDSDLDEGAMRRLKLTEGQIKFYLFLTVMVVMAVGNIVSADDKPIFAGPQYKDGMKGSDFEPISPCNRIPLSDDKTFGYLPILAGLFEDDFGGFDGAIDWLVEFLGLDSTLRKAGNIDVNGDCYNTGESCSLTSECCGGDVSNNELSSCELSGDERQCAQSTNPGAGFVWEPFCLMWSENNDSTSIDTLAFKPQDPWPPVEFVPAMPSLIPFCALGTDSGGAKVKGCKGCDFHSGFPIREVFIGKIPFKVTAKFDGIAVSWAKPGKIAFDPEYDAIIWDGFRDINLPKVDGMNFWLSLNFELIPLPIWSWGKTVCETDSDSIEEAKDTINSFFKLTLNMDLFVSIDTTDDDDGNVLAGQLGKNVAGANEETRHLREIGRELQENDPCVIITANADIAIPLLGTLKFGSIAGGYCTFPAEENGNRCTPSGAFLNINQEFKIEGGVGGILATFLEGMSGDMEMEAPSSGNSLGVFLNDGAFEAVVSRFEAPVVSLFGVKVPGAGRPIIHFQYLKGSEVERRRASILRTRVGGVWIPNCDNLASEGICDNNNDSHWADFGNSDTQICKNILINPDDNSRKLMYYNRVLTAELKNPKKESDNYLIRPPEGSSFQTPARYDFSNSPDANIVILYLGLADFGNFVIHVKEISLSLIFSDGAEPPIDDGDKSEAKEAYDRLSEDAKEIWRPPSGWHFPSLQEYLDHLPDDLSNISVEEVENANFWNSQVESRKNEGLRAYVRIFCKIAILFFIDISLGFIMMNYADNIDPSKWAVAAQFEASALGLLYSVAVTTVIDFDRRRHLHLEGQDYHRALSESGLEKADWDVSFSVGCVPGSFCEKFVEFFEDVGEAIWNGLQRIGEFFVEDIKKFAEDAIAMVGEWGKAFIGAIKDFANGVRDLFLNGAVGDVLNSERVKAFNEDAKKAVQTWSDGRFTLDDITAAGKLILQGVQIAIDFLVAGIKDIVNAIGDFFKNAGKAIRDCFTGAQWDEARHSGWRDPSECEAQCNPDGSVEAIKENCWCRDELGCRVKTPQMRPCVKHKLTWAFWKGCEKECGYWRDLPSKAFKNGKTRYPRFEGRRFDEACREERMAKLAEAEKKHGKMASAGETVDSNFQSKFNGMKNFSKEQRRQRRLEGGSAATVNSVNFQEIRATSDGVLSDNVLAQGSYDGSQLKPDSTDLGEVKQAVAARLDFRRYSNPGNGDTRRLQSEDILRQFQRGTADVYLEKQDFEDEKFMARQPVILPPSIWLAEADGTEDNPTELPCSGALANAWSLKLNSAEPQVMRRRRTKEVDHFGSFETVIEFPAEASVLQMILNGTIPITIIPGGTSDDEEDVFGDARELLGTDGKGKFMDTKERENIANMVAPEDPLDYEWEVDVVTAEPLCDKLQWKFVVTATDRTGTSNTIDLYAHIFYGETEVSNVPQYIQTRCDTSSIDVDDLEYNYDLQNMTGYDFFTPIIRTDNCPSPYIALMQNEDVVTNLGTPCTTDYRTIQRAWDLEVHTGDGHANCPKPSAASFPFVQTFVLGGLADEDGLPATPDFALRPFVTYYLPNEPNASVATIVSDFFMNGVPPTSECGICGNDTIASIFYNHTNDFACDDIGNNTVSVRVVNNIGIEVTKTATVTVVDDQPPNIFDKVVEVLEDDSIKGSVSIDAWDNCQIKSYALLDNSNMGHLSANFSLPIYEYIPDDNYFGPDRFSWMAIDWQENPSNVASVEFDVIPVNDPPYIYKSDTTIPVTILASDVDDSELSISAKHTINNSSEIDGLPMGLSFDKGICKKVKKGRIVAPGDFPWADTAPNAFPRGSECSWVLSKSGKSEFSAKSGKTQKIYNITLSVHDSGGGTLEAQTHTIAFTPQPSTKSRKRSKSKSSKSRKRSKNGKRGNRLPSGTGHIEPGGQVKKKSEKMKTKKTSKMKNVVDSDNTETGTTTKIHAIAPHINPEGNDMHSYLFV